MLRLLEKERDRPHGGLVTYLAEVRQPMSIAAPWAGILAASAAALLDGLLAEALVPAEDREPAAANDTKESHAMNRYVSLILFIVLVLGGGLVLGFLTAPGEWYAGLAKPSFNPPAWLFGPVWTVLYILIAIAGWRVWQRDRTGWPMKLWWVQLALNFLWTPLFFAAHQLGLALAIILLMLATIVGFMATAWRQDRVASWLFVPYAAWVAFASTLNGAIWALN